MKRTVFQTRKIQIEVPPSEVWRRLTDLARWPEWNPLCVSVRADGNPLVGSRFEYSNGKHSVSAEIRELAEPTRFGFIGRAFGVTAVNSWRIEPLSPTETLVEVSEQMSGLLPSLFPGRFNQKLGAGLESCLAGLQRSFRPEEGTNQKLPRNSRS